MKNAAAAFVCFCAAVSLVALSAVAVPPPPPSAWEHVFEDNNRIFIMTPTPHSDWMRESLLERYGEERMQIRSGLYYNTDPLEIIYYVDRLFHRHNLHFSECGIYFAHVLDASMSGLDAGAVWFFANGSLTRTYSRGDLLRRPTTSPFLDVVTFWENTERRTFDQQNNALTVVTAQRRAFTFDITTEEIIRGPSRRPSALTIFTASLLLVVIIVVVCKRRSKRKTAVSYSR